MNPYRVVIDRHALKFLSKLRDRKLTLRITGAIDELKNDPRPNGCEKLAGRDHQYRVRFGTYRIIYEVLDSELFGLVLAI